MSEQLDTSPSSQAKPPLVDSLDRAIVDYGNLQAKLVLVVAHGDGELMASVCDAMRGMLAQALIQRDEARTAEARAVRMVGHTVSFLKDRGHPAVAQALQDIFKEGDRP